jgi:nicotinate-nucleotide adenylyltransferase
VRLGVFGGTFDPVHFGHLILAEQCREQAQLDQVLFVPSARPPHKLTQPLTPLERRIEMLALAISGQPAFRIDDMEKDRPGPSYTVETLQILRDRQPEAELFLILGGDSVNDLPYWYEPRRILELASLLIVARPGADMPPLDAWREALKLPADFGVRCQVVRCPLIDIASRDVRQRQAEGKSIRYLVPRAVEEYIREKKLYSVANLPVQLN